MTTQRTVRVSWFFATFSVLALMGGQWLRADETLEGAEGGKKPMAQAKQEALEKDVTQGALRVVKDDGTVVECPLKHTDVKADVSGFIARVKVTQTFTNPTDDRIEAVYVFPLPHEAAVDDMTMVIGKRKIVGLVKRRAEARRIYEEALMAGQTAALLEQERPNIFTQSVGNIEPGQEVNIEISYVDVLRYDMGTYEFHFPMVVGPRFMPGAPIASPGATPPELQGKVSPPVPDTSRVPDASRISPPVLKPGFRTGHDVSLAVTLDAGVPIQGLNVTNHEAEIKRNGNSEAKVTLSPADSIPNKDFVLRYDVVGKKPEMAVLAHTAEASDAKRLGYGYFMLMIQPQEDERLTKSPPREIVFLIDVSGSMSGQPTAKVIETMQSMLGLCREQDTVQVVTFAGQAHQLFEKPLPVNETSIKRALNFTAGLKGSGGTHMLEGVKMAIDQPIDAKRLRIVVMLTDGYIGNEAEIIEHVGKHCGDQIRFWTIGIGQSPNMFLVDGVARQGGGMGKKLGLNDDAESLAQEVMTRIQRAQLAKIRIDYGELEVAETYPAKIPELWAGRPVILFGRYAGGGKDTITIRGQVEGEPVSWTLGVDLPEKQPAHDVLAKVWARQKIEALMQQTYYQGSPAVEEEVTAIALDYRLMSQYTSFVAVDDEEADKLERPATPPRRMLVPVPLPEGTQWEGFFGPLGELERAKDLVMDEKKNFGLADGRAEVHRLQRMQMSLKQAAPVMRQLAISGRPAATAMPGPGGAGHGYFKQRREAGQRGRWGALPSLAVGGKAKGEGAARYSLGYARSGRGPTKLQDGLSIAGVFREDGGSSYDGPARVESRYTAAAMSAAVEELAETTDSPLVVAQKALDKKDLPAARAALLRAWFLDTAAGNQGAYPTDQVAGQALEAIEHVHQEQVDAWKKQLPGLGKKLNLVLRDRAIGEALGDVAKAAGLSVGLLKGSTDDATELLRAGNVRVTYLDLRGATAAEALDWILQPARMTWRVADGKIVAGTERRLAGEAPWVYDVGAIALPSPEDLDKLGDYQKAVAAAGEEAKKFITAVRDELGVDEEAVRWYAPGQLLVFGDAKLHASTAELLANLADGQFRPRGPAAKIYPTTRKRAEERKEAVAKSRAARGEVEVAAVHTAFGWQLLAGAAGGRVDPEALTELAIAWRRPETARLLEGPGAAVVLRSAWAICESARALPENDELAALAREVLKRAEPVADGALTRLKERPDDTSALFAAIYGALAADEPAFTSDVLEALAAGEKADSSVAALRTVARALLLEPAAIDWAPLAKVLDGDAVVGDNMVVLTALSCRRAGGETWDRFREASGDLLARQPLSGNVVVLVHRLPGPGSRVAARQ